MLNDRIGSALKLLGERKFKATSNRAGRRTFEGNLNCAKGLVPVCLTIEDWDFLSYPEITLIGRPAFLPDLMPHIDVDGNLCYFSPGIVVLDRYRPDDAILQCLNQAILVLNRIAEDPVYRENDIQNEFLAHWIFGQSSQVWPVLLGSIQPNATLAQYYILNDPNGRRAMIACNASEANALCEIKGWPKPKNSLCNCWILGTTLHPTIPNLKFPSTIKELFNWLIQWDRNLYNRVQYILEKNGEYLENKFISFAVKCPAGWVGFAFDLNQITRLGSRKNPKLYKQYLHGKGGAHEILRLSITDVSPSFVHSRNLTFPDLRDRKITLIGCGAIGGYLAQTLVRLGAGSGNGSINLVDPDVLGAENLGRHYLGYSDLFKYKAIALRDELMRQFPTANIISHVKNVNKITRLFGVDLVINATGEESINELLNEKRLLIGPKAAPLLQVWIKGNGECVQSLWMDDRRYGCFRCLYQSNQTQYRQERFPVLKNETERRFIGCRAFTPYAVSAPMNAASLAADTIIDWIKGDPSPRFRTRITEGADVNKVKNQNVSRMEGCIACGTR